MCWKCFDVLLTLKVNEKPPTAVFNLNSDLHLPRFIRILNIIVRIMFVLKTILLGIHFIIIIYKSKRTL